MCVRVCIYVIFVCESPCVCVCVCVCLHPSSFHCTLYFLILNKHNQKKNCLIGPSGRLYAQWPTLRPVAEASIINDALDNVVFIYFCSINKMTLFEIPYTVSYVHHYLFFISAFFHL